MSGAYSAIGGAFEYLNDDCGYEQWSQYLIKKLASLGYGAGAACVDAGCGNGYFSRALERAGYLVTGVDISPEMLSEAVRLSRAEGGKTQYILGDITKLALNFKPDFMVAVNDCVNYIPQKKLAAAFKRIYSLLKKGGAFIFDISSENKLKNVIGNNLFSEDRGDYTYVWFNELFDDRVEMDITLFKRLENGLYERRDEAQTQYIHGETAVLSALEGAGFEAFSEGHLGGSKDERICFYALKK